MSKNIIKILLVEDNEGDIILIQEAFEDAKILVDLTVATDGQMAIDMLYKNKEYKNATHPDLILLDVNLPKLNGHEVLAQVKSDKNLKSIPVIMLTTSSSAVDINSAYKNSANCYITKPVDINEFLSVITTIENFWINIVKLPE